MQGRSGKRKTDSRNGTARPRLNRPAASAQRTGNETGSGRQCTYARDFCTRLPGRRPMQTSSGEGTPYVVLASTPQAPRQYSAICTGQSGRTEFVRTARAMNGAQLMTGFLLVQRSTYLYCSADVHRRSDSSQYQDEKGPGREASEPRLLRHERKHYGANNTGLQQCAARYQSSSCRWMGPRAWPSGRKYGVRPQAEDGLWALLNSHWCNSILEYSGGRKPRRSAVRHDAAPFIGGDRFMYKKCPKCGSKGMVQTVNGAICPKCGCRIIEAGHIFVDGPLPNRQRTRRKPRWPWNRFRGD